MNSSEHLSEKYEKHTLLECVLNPFTPRSDLIDFTLSNARQFYSSKGDPLGVKGLKMHAASFNIHVTQNYTGYLDS